MQTPAGQPIDPQSVLAGKTGELDATDKRRGGVTIQLGDAGGNLLHDAGGHVIQTVTRRQRLLRITGLMPGTYSVFEVQPNGYISGINTVGTSGGVAPKPGQALSPTMLDSSATARTTPSCLCRCRPAPFRNRTISAKCS